MAIETLNTIKNWFRTGLKPTQAQFWDTWDSFRHKNEKIPVKDIQGINELLAGAKIMKPYELLIFKRSYNHNNSIAESGDFVIGIVEGTFINALYLGGDITLAENFDIINQTELTISNIT
jgi:hypothetical protein